MSIDDSGLASLIQNAPVGLAVCDAGGLVVTANPFLCRLVGVSPEAITGRRMKELFSRASRVYFETQLDQLLHLNGGFAEVALTLDCGEGEPSDVLVSAAGRDGGVTYAVYPASARRNRERELANLRAISETKNKLLTQIERIATIGAWSIDLATMNATWSDAVFKIHGMPVGEPLHLDDALRCYPEPFRKEVSNRIYHALAAGEPFDYESEFIALTGEKRWVRSVAQVEYFCGKAVRLIGVLQDVTEQHAAREKLWQLAHFDVMTGLANRALVQKVLEEELPKTTDRQHSLFLMLLDLDGFKEINDALGHDAGDVVLKAVARRISGVNGSHLCGRLGGDEFVIVLSNVSEETALSFAHAVLENVGEPVLVRGQECAVSVSIGIACSPADAVDVQSLLKRADLALYSAKSAGRRCAIRYDHRLESDFDAKQTQLAIVRRARVDRTLKPHYQPKVSLRDGSIIGFEALARIESPAGDVMTPADFGLALQDDRGSLIIHDAILGHLLEDLRSWLAAGLEPGVVSFNLAEAALREPGFALEFLNRIRDAGVPATRIMIEITETVFLGKDSNRIKAILSILRAAGCEIALDDFGTGFASLSHLRDYPLDRIKIDKSFILGLGTEPQNDAIVTAIVGLARNLNIKVVAEGIEREDQRVFLQRLRCDAGQGYLFGKAITSTAAAALLKCPEPQTSSKLR